MSREEEVRRALGKPARYGPDLDLKAYVREAREWPTTSIEELPEEVTGRALEVGVDGSGSGMYFQVDRSVVYRAVERMYEGKVEVLSVREALEKYDWVEKLFWKLVEPDTDKYTALAYLEPDEGYFIRIHRGAKVERPIQTCMFVSTDRLDQNVHNLIVAEEGSEAHIVTGCTLHPTVRSGLHVGVSEFYVKRGAKLTFSMVHAWAEGFDVRPRSRAVLEDDATFVSNYVCLKPVRTFQALPEALCEGRNSRVRFNTVIYGSGSSVIDVGARAMLRGAGSRAEIVSRVVASDSSEVCARGVLVGEVGDVRGHTECMGLLLSEDASIRAVPELVGRSVGAELTHEAAIGKISEEQVEYLMARGFSREEAESLIVRGFMDVGVLKLPAALEEKVKEAVDSIARKMY